MLPSYVMILLAPCVWHVPSEETNHFFSSQCPMLVLLNGPSKSSCMAFFTTQLSLQHARQIVLRAQINEACKLKTDVKLIFYDALSSSSFVYTHVKSPFGYGISVCRLVLHTEKMKCRLQTLFFFQMAKKIRLK